MILLYNSKLKNIKFLKYDFNEKKLCLLKEEIKSVRNSLNYNFYDCFDDKNGNIIASDCNEIALWKRYKKTYL